MKVKEAFNPETIFGDLSRKTIWTDDPILMTDEIVTIVNSNCEFEYDAVKAAFVNDLMYAYIVELELLETDLSNYVPEKSNNGGCYAFAECKVKKIIEKGY